MSSVQTSSIRTFSDVHDLYAKRISLAISSLGGFFSTDVQNMARRFYSVVASDPAAPTLVAFHAREARRSLIDLAGSTTASDRAYSLCSPLFTFIDDTASFSARTFAPAPGFETALMGRTTPQTGMDTVDALRLFRACLCVACGVSIYFDNPEEKRWCDPWDALPVNGAYDLISARRLAYRGTCPYSGDFMRVKDWLTTAICSSIDGEHRSHSVLGSIKAVLESPSVGVHLLVNTLAGCMLGVLPGLDMQIISVSRIYQEVKFNYARAHPTNGVANRMQYLAQQRPDVCAACASPARAESPQFESDGPDARRDAPGVEVVSLKRTATGTSGAVRFDRTLVRQKRPRILQPAVNDENKFILAAIELCLKSSVVHRTTPVPCATAEDDFLRSDLPATLPATLPAASSPSTSPAPSTICASTPGLDNLECRESLDIDECEHARSIARTVNRD